MSRRGDSCSSGASMSRAWRPPARPSPASRPERMEPPRPHRAETSRERPQGPRERARLPRRACPGAAAAFPSSSRLELPRAPAVAVAGEDTETCPFLSSHGLALSSRVPWHPGLRAAHRSGKADTEDYVIHNLWMRGLRASQNLGRKQWGKEKKAMNLCLCEAENLVSAGRFCDN